MNIQTRPIGSAASIEALVIRGNALMDQGDMAAAIAAYRDVTSMAPQFAPGFRNLAMALAQDGRPDEAMAACSRAVELQPEDIDSYLVMAKLLLTLGRPDEAIALYELAGQVAPTRSDVQSSLAAALARQGRLDDAISACRRAIALDPDNVGAHLNLGVILSKADDPQGAVAAYGEAIRRDPHPADAHTNLGMALSHLGISEKAVAAAARAVELRPTDPTLHYNHAMLLLMAGDLAAGFRAFEWRLNHPEPRFRPRQFAQPRWTGAPRDGRTLLIHAEQGLGDTLHFARFVPAAAASGGPVVLQVQPPLLDLLRDSLPGVTVISRDAALPPFACHVPLMSLPHALGTDITTIPAQPYLAASPTRIAAWRQRLSGPSGLKVGVVWAGNPGHLYDHKRSLPAAQLLPRLLLPGVRLFSLQKDVPARDHATLAAMRDDVVDLAPELTSFAETAAAIAALDLVVSVDTSVAHLAGALGRPTWILLPQVLDWRWFYAREDTPWYPSARLFRQARPNDWAGVLDRLPGALQRLADAG